MALTLTIGGTNFLPQYLKDSAQIVEQIQNKGNTLTMTIIQKTGQTAPAVGKEIIFKDGSRFLFGGFISQITPTEYGTGQLIEHVIQASDYTYLLTNKSAQASYSNVSLYSIVIDLLTNVASGYGLSSSGVTNPGPTVTTVAFNHIPLRQCFEQLAKLTGYIWYIGYDKTVYFVDPATAAAAPETITDALSPNNHESLTISADLSQIRNDIIVLGGTQESSVYTQTITIVAGATDREWVLVYPVWTMTSIKLNGGAQTFGTDPDPEGTNYAMYNSDRGSVRLAAASTTPVGGDVLQFKFTYPIDVITEQQSAPSIAAMIALEGGDGIHSYTIDDSSILSTTQAIQQALQQLAAYANPILSGEFFTRTGLLSGGSFFKAGQLLTVNSPTYGINSNTTYIIQQVTTTIEDGSSAGGTIEYHYDVVFGGRLFGVVDFLLALGTPNPALPSDGQVRKIHANNEVITAADTASITKYSANSQWKPTGGQGGVWNLSQWN
jgi:hypothetical protein